MRPLRMHGFDGVQSDVLVDLGEPEYGAWPLLELPAAEEEKNMNVEIMKENQFKAAELHRQYVAVLKKHSEPYLKTLSRAYWHMSRRRGVIDVFEAIKTAGVNAVGDPRLAFGPASAKRIEFVKRPGGRGYFRVSPGGRNAVIEFPDGSFPAWPLRDSTLEWSIRRSKIQAAVPIIPPQFLPAGDLGRYYLLWEQPDWTDVTADPILLARISKNLFAFLAAWDLTPLERAVTRGRAN